MADRYFSETAISEDRVVLTESEAHHLIHVMRARPGSRVVLFDGSGAEFSARVEKVARAEVQLVVTAREEIDRELPYRLTLGVALPKGERQRWLVEKAVELGVGRVVPLQTARSVAQPVQQALARLQRAVIEASKQCGRNRLMRISKPAVLADFVAHTADAPTRLMAHPGEKKGHPASLSRGSPDDASRSGTAVAGPVLLAVGPEGGFTGEEVSLATAAGWRLIDLGPRILRVETAAILLVALVTQSVVS